MGLWRAQRKRRTHTARPPPPPPPVGVVHQGNFVLPLPALFDASVLRRRFLMKDISFRQAETSLSPCAKPPATSFISTCRLPIQISYIFTFTATTACSMEPAGLIG